MFELFYFNYPDTKVTTSFIWKQSVKYQLERVAIESVCACIGGDGKVMSNEVTVMPSWI
jgi:hypothetical protein